MKFYKRLNLYKASNVSFDPESMEAHSYAWWRFTEIINGKLVFNSYRYSPSTGKHQSKVRSLLSSLGHSIDLFIEAPQGLQQLDSAIRLYERRITDLEAEIKKPGTRKAKNLERAEQVEYLKKQIKKVKALIAFKERQYLKQAA